MLRDRIIGALSVCAALALPAASALADATLDQPRGGFDRYHLDSGVLENPGAATEIVYVNVVQVPEAHWLRLYFGDDTRLEPGSVLRMTSLLDGEVQELGAQELELWRRSTAYFNGGRIMLELEAAPGTTQNRVTLRQIALETDEHIDQVQLRGGPGQCGICNGDDRTPSSELWSARLLPAGCTASVYNVDSCMVSAGHCVDGTSGDIVQFNVPPSTSGCAIQHPPVDDQFPITAKQFANAGIGNDWAAMTTGPNGLGQRPYDRYGVLRPLGGPASVGDPSSIWGYGVDLTCVRSQTQQLSPPGAVTAVNASSYQFSNDVRGGNSGSGYLVGNEIVAVVTHCSFSGCPNFGTRIDLPAFVAARNAICEDTGGGSADCVCPSLQPLDAGDTLYAAVDNPLGNSQIALGDPCEVICGRFFSGGSNDLILGQWNISNGHDGFGACDCPTGGAADPGTGWYVYCDMLSTSPPFTPVDCVCSGLQPLAVGDTLYAAVDNPQGNAQIAYGDPGTLECGRFFGGGATDVLLLSWNISNGHDGFNACDCPTDGSAPAPTGWYVFCSEVTDQPGDPVDCVCPSLQPLFTGQTLYAAVDNPLGNSQIAAGDPCEVICGRFFSGGSSDLILGQWNITNGHDGFGACDCPTGGAADPGTGWYVYCNLLTDTASVGTCPSDLDGDGLVDASDLLVMLGAWGTCERPADLDGLGEGTGARDEVNGAFGTLPDCPADLDDDGLVGASDLVILLAEWDDCP